jgi:hypothetical protein
LNVALKNILVRAIKKRSLSSAVDKTLCRTLCVSDTAIIRVVYEVAIANSSIDRVIFFACAFALITNCSGVTRGSNRTAIARVELKVDFLTFVCFVQEVAIVANTKRVLAGRVKSAADCRFPTILIIVRFTLLINSTLVESCITYALRPRAS